MYRGTTPTLTITITGDNPELWDTVIVTIRQGDIVYSVDQSKLNISGQQIELTLTQQDTLALKRGANAYIQIRYKKGEYAGASSIKAISVDRILREGVI